MDNPAKSLSYEAVSSTAALAAAGHPVVAPDVNRRDIAIGVCDLVVGFGNKIILNHLDLDVFRGEILGVIGASGSGKSVLTRAILGLLPKRGGHVESSARTLTACRPMRPGRCSADAA